MIWMNGETCVRISRILWLALTSNTGEEEKTSKTVLKATSSKASSQTYLGEKDMTQTTTITITIPIDYFVMIKS